jgi:hypothetical protein
MKSDKMLGSDEHFKLLSFYVAFATQIEAASSFCRSIAIWSQQVEKECC